MYVDDIFILYVKEHLLTTVEHCYLLIVLIDLGKSQHLLGIEFATKLIVYSSLKENMWFIFYKTLNCKGLTNYALILLGHKLYIRLWKCWSNTILKICRITYLSHNHWLLVSPLCKILNWVSKFFTKGMNTSKLNLFLLLIMQASLEIEIHF